MNNIATAATIEAKEGDTPSVNMCPARGVQEAPAPAVKASKKPVIPKAPSPAKIKERIADLCQQYGLDYDQLAAVVYCESSFIPQYGDNGLAFGVAQFHKETFNNFCEGNYYDSYDQLTCMAQMFKSGNANHWSCFTKLYKKVIFRDTPKQDLALNQ